MVNSSQFESFGAFYIFEQRLCIKFYSKLIKFTNERITAKFVRRLLRLGQKENCLMICQEFKYCSADPNFCRIFTVSNNYLIIKNKNINFRHFENARHETD